MTSVPSPPLNAEKDSAAGPQRAVKRCPACGGASFAPVGGEAGAFDTEAGGKVFWHPPYAVNECAACGLFFKSHTLPLETLEDFYSRLDFKPYDYETLFPTDRLVLAALAGLGDGAAVLDYGCSTGRILARLPAGVRKLGMEINEPAAAIARGRGIQIVPEAAAGEGAISGLDAVVCMDVFEHLAEPVKLLETLARVLKPGGLLVLVTGNADAIATRDRLAEFWYFRLAGHFQMLSERHLRWLAATLRLQLAGADRSCHYDFSWRERLRQRAQSLAYFQFQRAPHSFGAALLRRLPVFRRAEHWTDVPALTCTKDHLVGVFRKS